MLVATGCDLFFCCQHPRHESSPHLRARSGDQTDRIPTAPHQTLLGNEKQQTSQHHSLNNDDVGNKQECVFLFSHCFFFYLVCCSRLAEENVEFRCSRSSNLLISCSGLVKRRATHSESACEGYNWTRHAKKQNVGENFNRTGARSLAISDACFF